ncbi:MAG: hypothetical protein ACI9DC_001525 [Gammaproteobacteria bacterium]|jgi:hypothetical protein
MMTAAQSKAETLERNRRESFRINDRVALCVRPLSESDYNQTRTYLVTTQHKQRTLNSILAVGDSQSGLLRNIRDSDPAVASYLKSLEDRLDALARLLVIEQNDTPDVPTHDVNISGNGLRFGHPEALEAESHLALDMQLFPSRTCLSMLAVVVRSKELKRPAKNGGRFTIAVDFCDVHEADRELLIRHVHGLQLDYARRGALRDRS